MNEREIFIAALQREDPVQRLAFLDQACAQRPGLRKQVEKLLGLHEGAGSFLEQPAAESAAPATLDQLVLEGAGTQIGPYKVMEQIGEGGMGLVFVAEQHQPVRRKVALKLIKPGLDSREIIARFEAERQALALMDHLNIARVLDAGATASGRPYFVMELVKGVPITQFCDDKRLTPRERLELFTHVCQAVQHAHQKGIIHRDIKPSNVLVTSHDGLPVVKVIDFGVAKAVGQQLTERTIYTALSQLVGTPLYMSPEQAGMSGLDVDTRTDIYSLGVLLYELLTGTTPFDKDRLKQAAYDEMRRIIREEEPQKPSTRISMTDAAVSIAAQRHTEPAKLAKLVRGDLDWIVMKALDKDRARRYETANAFAADVLHYLADEPVLACPPSASYRFRKFARRNKVPLAFAGSVLFFIVLLGGVVGWGIRDRKAREQEVIQETQHKLALTEDEIHQALDRGSKRRVELHALLKKPGGVQHLLNQPTRWELCIQTFQSELAQAQQLASRAEGNLRAETTRAIDQFEQQLMSDQADYDLARRLEKIRLDRATWVEDGFDAGSAADEYAKAFAGFAILSDDPAAVSARLASSPIKDQLVAALDDWVLVAVELRQTDLAGRLLAAARQTAPDPALGDRLRQLEVWADQEALGKLVAQTPVAGLSPQLLALVGSLLRGDRAQRESWLRRAQAEHPADFWLNYSLGWALQEKNPLEAAGYYRVALAIRPENSATYNNLGITLDLQEKLPEAIAAYRKAIEFDPNHGFAYNNLGLVLVKQQKLPEAIAAYRRAIELDARNLKAYGNLAAALKAQGNLEEAIRIYDRLIELDPKSPLAYDRVIALHASGKPVDTADLHKVIDLDPESADLHLDVGLILAGQNKSAQAIVYLRKAIDLDENSAKAHYHLGNALYLQGKVDEAITNYRRAIEIAPEFANVYVNLGAALYDQKQLEEAITNYRKAIEINPKHAKAYNNLANALSAQGKVDDAITCYRKAIELDPKSANANASLGETLAKKAWDLANHADLKVRDCVGALELSKEAVEFAPRSAAAWQYLGWVQYRAGNWESSIEALENSCRLQEGGTGDAFQWLFLAMAHWQLDHKEHSRKWYDKAIQVERVWPEILRDIRAEAEGLMGVNETMK